MTGSDNILLLLQLLVRRVTADHHHWGGQWASPLDLRALHQSFLGIVVVDEFNALKQAECQTADAN